MKIKTSAVTKLKLSDLKGLDPVTVFAEDLGPNQGKILIECYGQSWSAYWGGMGCKSVAQFFCSCSADYLAERFGFRNAYATDFENLQDNLKKHVIQLRKTQETSKHQARHYWDDITTLVDQHSLESNDDLLHTIIGDEWWHGIPEHCTNEHEYNYLCRIINAVQHALKTTSETQPTEGPA